MTSIISGTRTRRVGLVLLAALGVLLSSALPASASLPDTSTPTLSLDRTIQTTPFVNSSTSMRDGEGSAYVTGDNSLWLTEDHDNFIFEVDPGTGDLKRVINNAAFQNAPLKGGGPVAGPNRTDDFEAMAYDAFHDWLFVFSGPCCTSSNLPTAFRLVRDGGGDFQVESYQPLASTADYTAAAWNPADMQLYVGHAASIHSYDYESNTTGTPFSVLNLSGVLGFAFSSPGDTGGTDLFVTTNGEKLRRVDWATKTLVAGWTFDLLPFDVLDSRAVELINDQFYVLDGYDARPPGPLRFAVFVFDVLGPAPVAPVASFNASPMSGNAPLTVNFTDTSTGSPTSWAWDFENDGTTDSTAQNPSHVYDTAGIYTAKLTATNSGGSDSTTEQISVTPAGAPVASFTADPESGDAPLTVTFTDTSSGNPTSWAWDFEDDGITDSTAQNPPPHEYSTPGTYTAELTVSDGVTPSVATKTITVNAPPTNLVGNPGFETGLSGWGTTGSGNGVTIAQVTTPVHSGSFAARLFNGATGKRKCVLNDVPNWVTTTAAGTYTASIWVRGDVAGALIKINIKEMNGSSVVKSRVTNHTLTTSWQLITVSHAPLSPGSTSLDLQVFLPKAQAPPGTCFYADDASILKS
jgi:PKD repeat protein